MSEHDMIVDMADLPTYGPPLHSGTVNRRLVHAELGAGVEVVHGTIEPGGAGHRHSHATEWQVIILLKGEGDLALGNEAPRKIHAGATVRIPPRTPHLFEVTGTEPAEVIVIYSPPLGAEGFIAE
jgi:quercetin dioxygenase-like cupin family protein